MPNSVDKRAKLTRQILEHISREGFASVHQFSRLAKEIQVGRSLLYFYFKSTDEILKEVGEHFMELVREHHRYLVTHQLTFKEYVYSLLEVKTLVFFTLECQKELQRIPSLQEYVDLAMSTLDRYSFNRFKEYYQVDEEHADVEFLYACFRSRWWESIGSYDAWSKDSVDVFLSSLDQLMRQYISPLEPLAEPEP